MNNTAKTADWSWPAGGTFWIKKEFRIIFLHVSTMKSSRETRSNPEASEDSHLEEMVHWFGIVLSDK